MGERVELKSKEAGAPVAPEMPDAKDLLHGLLNGIDESLTKTHDTRDGVQELIDQIPWDKLSDKAKEAFKILIMRAQGGR